MQDSNSRENDFLTQCTEIIEENISNKQFGVSELAQEVGMSRSNLLRKIKTLTNLSVSQFIRQVRLQHAIEMLKQGSFTVSEVSYKVGFSSTSYFIKCFHDHYGFPPGEVGKKAVGEDATKEIHQHGRKKVSTLFWVAVLVALLAAISYVNFKPLWVEPKPVDKSIAVLPFLNDSNDSTNVHIINGLMESVLNNLQKIEDLRVVSRTSVEKYRNSSKIIPEIGKELNVRYFVEGSGQKIDNQILLNIQLIEASTDRHLWAKQYDREAGDIFNLQKEVAKSIAQEVEAIITPEEEERIDKSPTDNLEAYDIFLKGLDLLYNPTGENAIAAISHFKEAIRLDNQFARAYAGIAIAFYYLDAGQAEKRFSDSINYYADKALLFDSKLAQSLIAKALSYMNIGENAQAVPYFEKALEYNPNSALVAGFLAEFYVNYVPNTEKYLEYALKGIGLNIAAYDSLTISFTYLHVSNAFVQSGFSDEAEKYINRSLDYFPENIYSMYVKPYILFTEDNNLEKLRDRLLMVLEKDTTRLDVLQEVGKAYFYLRDYKNSYKYYRKYLDIKEALNLKIYQGENIKIGYVLSQMGMDQESAELIDTFKQYAENDNSLYKHLSLAAYYSYQDDTEKAIQHLKEFTKEENYHYWIVAFLEIDPLMDNLKTHPEFRKTIKQIETKFWDYHKRVKASLEEMGLV